MYDRTMTNRTKTYYIIRSIIRFVVKVALLGGGFIGIHLAAESIWSALALSAVLWGVYAAMVVRDRRKATAAVAVTSA